MEYAEINAFPTKLVVSGKIVSVDIDLMLMTFLSTLLELSKLDPGKIPTI
jgi:hypothetical protein